MQAALESAHGDLRGELQDLMSAVTVQREDFERRFSDVEARLRMEYVYANRNEVQTLHLKKNDGRWKIIGISGTDQIKTLIPYGTAVTDD